MQEDPEKIEFKKIIKFGDFKNKTILDIGCGKGERTLICAPFAKKVVGIDPNSSLIKKARETLPPKLKQKVTYRVGIGEKLDFPDNSFDTVFFSWSLHHIPIKNQTKALKEAHRVLNPNGQLLILEPTLRGERIKFTEIAHSEIAPVKKATQALVLSLGKLFKLQHQERFMIKYYFKNETDVIDYFQKEANLRSGLETAVGKLLKNCRYAQDQILIREEAKILSLQKNS